MARQPTTWLYVSGYRFLLRRVESALLRRDVSGADERIRAPSRSLLAGSLLATIIIAGCAALAVLRPHASLGNAPIVLGQQSGALFVRVGDTLHPVLNLASARLITATAGNPEPVDESELRRIKRGPLLGIPGAPQALPEPLSGDEARWTVCDSDEGTTVVVGAGKGPTSHRLTTDQTVLVTPDSGASAYLLYSGRRALVNLADPAVVGALRVEGRRPRQVSRALLNAIPESPPIAAPRIRGAGDHGPGALSGFPVGSVLRMARADGDDDYYVVLSGGVQRVGRVTADLLRLTDSHGTRTIIAVAPDLIRAGKTVTELPVSTFPDRAAPLIAGEPTLCVQWAHPPSGGADIAVMTGGLPVAAGQTPVALSQADGNGPAVDAVYVPPGRLAYVRSTGLLDGEARAGTRYVVTDTGVRFAVHDEAAAHDLGLPPAAVPAPWPVLATLPAGPELSRANASIARDTVSTGGAGARLTMDPP